PLPPRAGRLRAQRARALRRAVRRAARRRRGPCMRDPNRPPRPGRGVLWRALIAAVLTIGLSATAVASAGLLDVHKTVQAFTEGGRTVVDIPEIDESDAGDPRTFLILGSDTRYGDKKLGLKPRSDTLMLVRVDPHSKRIAVMSLPRDLKVKIPG